MEFTELVDYPSTPGVLTEWLPVPADPDGTGTENWFADPRPSSFVQAARLREAADHTGPGKESWLGTAFEISGRLDEAAFERTLKVWIDRHEALRSHAAVNRDSGTLTRQTLDEGQVAVRSLCHGHVASAAEVLDRVQSLFDRATSPLSWPAYAFATVAAPDERSFTVYFAADHAIIDGLTIVLISNAIAALYREQRGGQQAGLIPVGSYLDYGVREREDAADLGDDDPVVRAWRHALDRNDGHLPRFPLELGDRPAEAVPQGSLSTWVLDPDSADAFGVACRKVGHSFFAGALACLGLVGAELTDADRFETVTPMHTRHDPYAASSVGWYVGVGPIGFDVRGARSFTELAGRAAEQVTAAKVCSRVPFDRVCEVLGRGARPRFVVSYMDIRFAPSASRWREWKARALRSKQYSHDVYIWINRTPEGVNIAARYPDTDIATDNVNRYLDRLRTLMEEVVRTGSCRVGEPSESRSKVITAQ
ncbi:condensation domain-containing protein [Rhodococcus kronopolitis]|uniref:Condensation domain-containing protein n=1 Tax=Rhodococcus kronopolitis TaxID=1460226 RepID=A0ABV9FLK0_9NOCA